MSIDALKWAWTAPVDSASERLVLLSLADRAGEEHTAWPSIARLENDTKLNRKTVQKVIADLIEKGLLADTGERKGSTRSVRVLKLLGVNDMRSYPKNGQASNDDPSIPKNGIASSTSNPNSGTATDPNIGHAQNSSSPKNGMASDPKIGIQNLPLNPKIKNKKNNTDDFLTADEARAIWIPSLEHVNTLLAEKQQPASDQAEIDNLIIDFNRNNHGKDHSQNQMYLHFRIWIINARAAAGKVKSTSQPPATGQKQGKATKHDPADTSKFQMESPTPKNPAFDQRHDWEPFGCGYTVGQIRKNLHQGETPEYCLSRLISEKAKAGQQ